MTSLYERDVGKSRLQQIVSNNNLSLLAIATATALGAQMLVKLAEALAKLVRGAVIDDWVETGVTVGQTVGYSTKYLQCNNTTIK